jgi:hypothetical protein
MGYPGVIPLAIYRLLGGGISDYIEITEGCYPYLSKNYLAVVVLSDSGLPKGDTCNLLRVPVCDTADFAIYNLSIIGSMLW